MATNTTTRKVIVIDVQGKDASVTIDGVKSSFKGLNAEITRMKTGMEDTNMATGSASATVLELGRAVSDSNYGIRGMANNLSQLASNFVYTTKQAGTFWGGLMDIKNAMLGPLGFILLFQTGIALLERWAINSEKSTEATKDFSDTLAGAQGSAATNLKVLRDTLSKNMLTQQEANDAVREANKEYKGLNLELDENYQLTEDSVFAIDVKIIALERLAKATALQSKLSEKYGELLELEAKQTELDAKAMEAQAAESEKVSKTKTKTKEEALNARHAVGEYYGSVIAATAKAKKAQKENLDLIDNLSEEIQGLLKLGGEQGLISEMFKGKDPKGGRGKTAKDILEEEFQFDLQEWYRGELAKFDMARQMEFDLQEEVLDRRKAFTSESLEMQSEANMILLNDRIKHEEEMLSHTLLTDEERVDREQNLSMMRIELQDKELEHELMIIEMKMQAQLEYANFVSGIGNVFKTLGRENEDLAKVALVLQKGAAIAGVVVEAQAANQKILSASQTEVGFYKASAAATALLSPAKSAAFQVAAEVAQAGAAKRIAKNNIGAGIAIANILATTLTSRTAPSGGGRAGGGAGGGGGRTFDFNLVGSTGTNQLAEAVGGQFQEPIQAYVVSNEITSQQELDLQIQTGASLGD
ncbi:hypothetical protein [uncultured Mediterranean phage uvMED]|nr:hypothetical protein [uncultured Mediterranean phage uvMED]